MPCVLGSTGAWSLKTNSPAGTRLPAGADLPDGPCLVHAVGVDKAGNSKSSAVNSFIVDTAPPAS